MEHQHLARRSQRDHQRQPLATSAQPTRPPEHPLRQLQRTIGNRAVGRLIQAQLRVSQPGDAYEQKADRVADQIVAMFDPVSHQPIHHQSQKEDEIRQKSLALSIAPLVQRQETPEEDAEDKEERIVEVHPKPLLRTANREGKDNESSYLDARLNFTKGRGSPIADEVRAFFEPRMQFDFSTVRIHNNSEGAQLNRELGAKAFTHDRDIYFGANEYSPDTVEGKRLLAHELTHVVQQGGVQRSPISPISESARGGLVQRVVPAAIGAAEWIALGVAGYVVAQDAVKSTAGDVSYTFDEMEGVLLPGGGSDVAAYRTSHPKTNIRSHTHTVSVWQGFSDSRRLGIQFGITFHYDGYAIGNISCSILDTYDWPFWDGSVNVNFTPLSLAAGGVAAVRITLNVNADRTLRGGRARSRIIELDGTGTLSDKGGKAWVSLRD